MEGYKASNYTTIHKTDYGLTLFNTYSCGLLKITDEEAKRQATPNAQIVPLLAAKSPDYMQLLIDNGFLIKNDVDEFALLKSRMYRHKYSAASAGITINTGLVCNCRCTYCYEGQEHSDKSVLTYEKASDIVVFIKEKFKHNTRLDLSFLGGEPLICFEQIKLIYTELKDVFGHVTLGLTTNGVLVNEDVAIFLKEAKAKSVQVSIDGLKRHHDKKRVGVNGEGTYDRIVAGVKILQDAGVHVNVRTHIDQEFMDNVDLQEWVGAIKQDFDLTKPIVFYVAPVLTSGQGSKKADEKHIEHMVSIYEVLIDNGIPVRFNSMFKPAVSCVVVSESNLSISCDGEIYKCWYDLAAGDYNGRSFGNIYDGVNQAKVISYANSLDVLDDAECRACAYLPVCCGGCPEYVLSGTNKCTALRHYPEKLVGLFMRQKGYPLEKSSPNRGEEK